MPSVSEYCKTQPRTAGPGFSLLLMGMVMRDFNIDCVVVVDNRKAEGPRRPVGILSDREIVRSWVRYPNKKIHHIRMDEVMAEPYVVKESADLTETLDGMREKAVLFAPVVSEEGSLVGLLSLDALTARPALAAE